MIDPTDHDEHTALATAFRRGIEREIPSVSTRVDAGRAWADGRTASRRRGYPLRRPVLAATGVAAAIAAVAAVLVTAPGESNIAKPPGAQPENAEVLPAPVTGGPTTTQSPLGIVPNTSGIPGVVEYDTTVSTDPHQAGNCLPAGVVCHVHVTGPVAYSVTPPVGGPHNPSWMTCGVYDKPVPSERAVHDLEHGAVWITYRPDLPAGQVGKLQDLVRAQTDATLDGHDLGSKYLDLTPWASDVLPAPIVISSWGAQLAVSSPDDPRLEQFIDTFRVDAAKTYEAGAACTGQPDGGTPLFS
jgi:hypothetical protein